MKEQRLISTGAVRALLALSLLSWPIAACRGDGTGGAAPTMTAAATAPAVMTVAPTAVATSAATTEVPANEATPVGTPAVQDDAGSGADAGDGPGAALTVALDRHYDGLLQDPDLEDWYVLTAPGGATVTVGFEAGAESEGMSVALLSAERDQLVHSPDLAAGRSQELRYVLGASTGGDMLLQVNGAGAYAFEVSAPPQDDAAAGEDAGDSYSDAVDLGAQEAIEGLLGGSDISDWYSVDMAGGSVLSLRFAGAGEAEDLSVTLFDSHRQDVWHEWSLPGGVVREMRYLLDAAVNGVYFVAVEGGPGEYALDLSVAQQDDAGAGTDAPDNLHDALSVDLNDELTGEIGDEDDGDSYFFAASEGLVLSVTPARGAEDLMVVVYDGEGAELWYDYVDAEDTLTYTLEGAVEGDYVLQVAEGFGSYMFVISE